MIKEGRFQKFYRVGQLIGKGTLGEVRVCQLKAMGKREGERRQYLAVRMYDRKLLDDDDKLMRRFETETMLLHKLSHTNILRLHEIFEDNDRYYVVTDLCLGGELFDTIENHAA